MADTDRSALEDARKRARRRLVGAIVLALGAAVVLPMFLETDPRPLGPDVQLQIPPIDDGKFQNRLTPETKGGKAASDGRGATPPAEAAKAAAASAAAPSGATPAPAPAMTPESTKAAESAKAAAPAPSETAKAAPLPAPAEAPKSVVATPPPAAPKPSAATAAIEAPKASQTPVSAPSASSTGAAPATPPPAQASQSAAAGASSPFVIQIGAFVGLPIAVELADKAREQGYPVFMEKITVKGGQVHRVRVGPYNSQADAQADAVKLKLAGFTADVRKR